jgi:hypothetical protein
MERTLRLDLDGFTGTDISLETYPVSAVASIKYDDSEDATEQTVDTADYYTYLEGEDPMVRAVDFWPSTYYDKPGRVRITMTAGYSSRENIPEDFRQAILVQIFTMWNDSGSAGDPRFMAQARRKFM